MGWWFDWDEMKWVDMAIRPRGQSAVKPQKLSPFMRKITGCRTMGEFMKLAYSPEPGKWPPEPNAPRMARQ